jgi:cell division septation protein DedD
LSRAAQLWVEVRTASLRACVESAVARHREDFSVLPATEGADRDQRAAGDGIARIVAKGLNASTSRETAKAAAAAGLARTDLADMKAMHVESALQGKAVRAEHKFQKKPNKQARVNARVCAKAGVSPYGGCGEDGAGLEAFVQVGKKGGVIR